MKNIQNWIIRKISEKMKILKIFRKNEKFEKLSDNIFFKFRFLASPI